VVLRTREWLRRLSAVAVGLPSLLAATPSFSATQTLAPSDDTFINSGNADNNNGGSSSVFTGTDGHGGTMRALVRFAMPAGLQGRATITNVQLRLTLRALGNGTVGQAAVDTLQAVTQPWIQGNGTGEAPSAFTVGQPCSGTIIGATWNQTNCATSTAWTTAGGTVVASPSGQADTTGVGDGAPVIWDSASNPAMVGDVQSWIDAPANNDGWRVASSTEGVVGGAQRFYSTEADMFVPSLTVTYACKPGFVEVGTSCAAAPQTVPAAPSWALALLAVALGATALVALRRGRSNRSSRFVS